MRTNNQKENLDSAEMNKKRLWYRSVLVLLFVCPFIRVSLSNLPTRDERRIL